jgi:hypothetical protein
MTITITKLPAVGTALASALQTLNVFPRVQRAIVRNPVVIELRRSLRRIGLVKKLWQLDRADAAAARSVAYERAFLKMMERGFDEQLQANRDKRHQLRLKLINLDAEALR